MVALPPCCQLSCRWFILGFACSYIVLRSILSSSSSPSAQGMVRLVPSHARAPHSLQPIGPEQVSLLSPPRPTTRSPPSPAGRHSECVDRVTAAPTARVPPTLPNDIVLAVMTTVKRHGLLNMMRKNWLRDARAVFLTDAPGLEERPNQQVVIWPGNPECGAADRGAPTIHFANVSSRLEGFKWVIMVDDDVLVNTANLARFLSAYDPDVPLWFTAHGCTPSYVRADGGRVAPCVAQHAPRGCRGCNGKRSDLAGGLKAACRAARSPFVTNDTTHNKKGWSGRCAAYPEVEGLRTFGSEVGPAHKHTCKHASICARLGRRWVQVSHIMPWYVMFGSEVGQVRLRSHMHTCTHMHIPAYVRTHVPCTRAWLQVGQSYCGGTGCVFSRAYLAGLPSSEVFRSGSACQGCTRGQQDVLLSRCLFHHHPAAIAPIGLSSFFWGRPAERLVEQFLEHYPACLKETHGGPLGGAREAYCVRRHGLMEWFSLHLQVAHPHPHPHPLTPHPSPASSLTPLARAGCVTSPHLTSPHLTSPHLTSPHTTPLAGAGRVHDARQRSGGGAGRVGFDLSPRQAGRARRAAAAGVHACAHVCVGACECTCVEGTCGRYMWKVHVEGTCGMYVNDASSSTQ